MNGMEGIADTGNISYVGEDYWDYFDDFLDVDYVEHDLANAVYIYVSPLLLLIGTLGNLTSLLVLRRLAYDVLSTCFYLALLAIVDLVVLYTRCGNDWLQHVADIDLSNMLMVSSEAVCKVYPFVFNFVFHLSKWLLVAMAIEGFIATRHPSTVHKLCTLQRAQAVVLLLTVLLVCVNIHYFWSFELIELKEHHHPHGLFCTFAKHGHQHSEEFQRIIWPVMDMLVAEVIPYIVVIVCGTTMLCQMISGRHRGDVRYRQWRNKYQLHPEAVDQLKVTILLVCAFYMLLCLPKFAFIIFRYLVEAHDLIPYSLKLGAQQDLTHAVCATMEYCFLAGKFFIYVASSRHFRDEFVRMMRSCCCRRRGQRGRSLCSSSEQMFADHQIIRNNLEDDGRDSEGRQCLSLGVSSDVNENAVNQRDLWNSQHQQGDLSQFGTMVDHNTHSNI